VERIKVSPAGQEGALARAAAALARGGLVIFPAERLYGLAADANNPAAVRAVFALKGRSERRPLPVIVSDAEEAKKWVAVPGPALRLMERFWPGPLTLVLPAKVGLAPELLAGGDHLGIRPAGNALARELARLLGGPITATSANLSGEDSCWDLDRVEAELAASVELALDVGRLAGPPGSTVVTVSETGAHVLREGVIARNIIAEALGGVRLK